MSVFSADLKTKIESELKRYETQRSAILPILHAIQDKHKFVSEAQVEALEKEFGLSRVHVREVLTFYTMYRTEEPAQFEVLFCDNIVCSIMGAKEAIAKIEQRVAAYEKSGKSCPVSVQGVPCLGVCDGAPAMLVNKDRHLRVTAANVDAILDKYAPI